MPSTSIQHPTTQHPTLTLTRHASDRVLERTPPASVVHLLKNGAHTFLGHDGDRYRVVRTTDAYWIASYSETGIHTIYARPKHSIRGWVMGKLRNPDQQVGRFYRLPIHTPTDIGGTQ